jgi:murein L,D-transpeptidase YafK
VVARRRTLGCDVAMTDYEMEEIYGLADEAFKGGQDNIHLKAFPFRSPTTLPRSIICRIAVSRIST